MASILIRPQINEHLLNSRECERSWQTMLNHAGNLLPDINELECDRVGTGVGIFERLTHCGEVMISIRRALFLVCLLLISAPLVLFWAWPQARLHEHEANEVRQYHLLMARTVGRTLERYHQDLVSAFNHVTAAPSAPSGAGSDSQMLRSLNIRHIASIDAATGTVSRVIEGSRSGTIGPVSAGELARLKALAIEQMTTTSGASVDADGVPVLTLVRRSGPQLIVATVETTYIAELGRQIRFGELGHMVIVDTAGRALAHPDAAWERAARDLSGLGIVKRVLAGEAGVTEFFSPAFGADMIAGFAPVRGAGWGVMVPQPIAELRKAAHVVQQRVFSIFAIGLLVAALIAIRAGIIITAPLSQLTASARKMAEGDLDVRIEFNPRHTPFELVVLNQSFNNMAERVAELGRRSTELRERAEKANTSKTEFVRTVTHELRSPVNAIVGFSELLTGRSAAKITPEMRDSYLRDISAGARHMLSLVNDLLDLAKMESGQYELVEVDFWVDEITRRASRYVETLAIERGVEVTVSFDGEPPLIHGDERALFQALLNLVSNAVRYGRHGGTVAIATRITATGNVEIVVCDDGPGIAPEDLDRVMLPFQRVHSPANPGVSGTGLGLPIVKRFVELHGGTFSLSSVLGHGTRARIVLPSTRVRAGTADIEQACPVTIIDERIARAA
jgi:signal transduction histidine kinase